MMAWLGKKASGLVAGLLGPKVLLGILAAGGLAVWLLWSQLGDAQEKVATERVEREKAQSELTEALAANRDQDQALADLRAENARQVEVITQLADDVRTRALRAAEIEESLREADRDAPIEYRDCLRVPVPRAVDDLMWIGPRPADAGGGDPDGGGTRADAGAADASVPDPES